MSAQPAYQVRYNQPGGMRFYGDNREAFYTHAPEFVLSGGAESGKTFAMCWKYHLLALKYPGLRGLIVRKSQKSLYASVLRTWERVTKGAPITVYGGSRPEAYNYSNGSQVWVGGMDNSDKVLSSEWDWIYPNQAEELTVDDWEKLLTRATGRGAVMPYTQVGGDCNPGGRLHWIRERASAGKLLLLTSSLKDNPTLYRDGEITEQGKRTLGVLDSLTGIRRKRLLEGIWATAEGAIYGEQYDPTVNIVERNHTEFATWYLAMDEGYTNPAVILLVGEDADGRLHVAREFYKRGMLQSSVVATAREWCNEKQITAAIVDEAAAGLIADLRDNEVPAQGHKGRVLDGISTMQDLLMPAGDGRPRLTIAPECIETQNEFESYAWKPERDEPAKEFDHAMDALRYLAHFRYFGANWFMT